MGFCRILLIVVCCIGTNTAFAELYKWTGKNGNVHFSNTRPAITQGNARVETKTPPSSGREENVLTSSMAKPNAGSAGFERQFSTGGGVFLQIRRMLEQRRFDDLNRILHSCQIASEADLSAEGILFTSYYAFGKNDTSFEVLLSDWIAYTPDKYQPYLARARYYYDAGWNARGGKWASETTQGQFREMDDFFIKAMGDIAMVLKRYDNHMVPYEMLIGMAQAQDQEDEAEKYLRKALEINPATYRVRARYLRMIAPRWGGSFEEMKAFVEESLHYVSQNPKLNLLTGLLFAEAGDTQKRVGRYSVAEKLYTQALLYGENREVLYQRGKTRYRREDYLNARDDLNRAIELYGSSSDYFYWRSRVYYELKQYDKAAIDIELADKLEPGDRSIERLRAAVTNRIARQGHEFEKDEQMVEALSRYEAAIGLEPENATLHYDKALALIETNQLDSALGELERAVELDPDEINFYMAIDHVLAIRKDWQRIIEYWNQYIFTHPDSSRAYLERSGTHHHKGDKEAARIDLETAASMGSRKAKQLLKRYYR